MTYDCDVIDDAMRSRVNLKLIVSTDADLENIRVLPRPTQCSVSYKGTVELGVTFLSRTLRFARLRYFRSRVDGRGPARDVE